MDDRAVDTLRSEGVADSLKFITPKGKIVYGGGGIIPDVYVPYDENFNSNIVEFLKGSGLIDFFVFEHLDGQRDQYFSFSESEFLSTFEISKVIYQQFETHFSKTTRLDKTKLDTQEDFIKILLKSAFAKQLFGDNTAAKVMSSFDPMLQKINDLEALILN